jgi:Fibronectin type III-like domain
MISISRTRLKETRKRFVAYSEAVPPWCSGRTRQRPVEVSYGRVVPPPSSAAVGEGIPLGGSMCKGCDCWKRFPWRRSQRQYGTPRELAGFMRVALAAGERKTVDFALTRAAAGTIEITAGGMAKSCKISQ